MWSYSSRNQWPVSYIELRFLLMPKTVCKLWVTRSSVLSWNIFVEFFIISKMLTIKMKLLKVLSITCNFRILEETVPAWILTAVTISYSCFNIVWYIYLSHTWTKYYITYCKVMQKVSFELNSCILWFEIISSYFVNL